MTSLDELTAPRVEQDGPDFSASEFVYVDISSVDNQAKRIVDPKALPPSQAPSRARQRLRTGDVLVSMTRPNLNAVAIVPPVLDGSVGSTGFHVLRARDGVQPEWLFYGVQTRRFIDEMCALVQGALYPAVRPKDIRTFQLPTPSKAEQLRIVGEIEKQFSRLDAAVDNLQRVKANLKRYQASVLAEAFAGSLVPQEATLAPVADEPFESGGELISRLARMRGAEASRPTAEFLPTGWALGRIGDCFEVVVGATPSRNEARYWGGPIPWVSSGEVQFGRIRRTQESISELGLQNSSTKLNPAGSVLIGMIGQGRTRGQAAILDIEAANNQNCAAIWVSCTPMPSEFVFYWLMHRYQETRSEGSGNNQQALNKKLVQAIPIPMPPLREQHRIAAELERRLSIISGVEAQVDANLKRAQALRQAVLAKAFGGTTEPQAEESVA